MSRADRDLRRARIDHVRARTGCSDLDARYALERHGWDEGAAIAWLRRSVVRMGTRS